jgi:hypothetical protein
METENSLPCLQRILESKARMEAILEALPDSERLLSGEKWPAAGDYTSYPNLSFSCDYDTVFHMTVGNLFVANHGHIGLAPLSAMTNDEICFIQGARVPFVIHKTAGNRYTLIGECFLFGMVHGEVENLGLPVEDILFE